MQTVAKDTFMLTKQKKVAGEHILILYDFNIFGWWCENAAAVSFLKASNNSESYVCLGAILHSETQWLGEEPFPE